MIFITGGAYQGKTDYALSLPQVCGSVCADGSECGFDDVFGAVCVNNYHLLIKRLIGNDRDPLRFTEQLCEKNPAAVIIMTEIGCGIIPLEKSERYWREMTGRCGCIIAERSDSVIRLVCGIPAAIKGELI